jgi:hypothetical protein
LQTGIASVVIGASITRLIFDIQQGNTFSISVDLYALAAGTLNFGKSFFNITPQIEYPIEALIKGFGAYFNVSESKQNFVTLMAYGAALGIAAEGSTTIKRVIYSLAVLSMVKAGFEYGKAVARTGEWF